jgi:5-methylcytosine-specific restriction protein A
MRHYVLYSNEASGADIEWPEDFEGFQFGIVTKKRTNSSIIGSQIWLVRGHGSPTQFQASYSFTADSVEDREDGLSGSRVSGTSGIPFIPPITLNDLPWFAELRRSQFQSRGLSPVNSPEVVEGLIDLLSVFDDDDSASPLLSDILGELASSVAESLTLPASDRQQRLAVAPRVPERFAVIASVFERNPDVIAEVLLRANGTCEKCHRVAPFARRSDGTPYLEVHHWKPLSEGGEDTVENAGALCPNCHREAHFG